MARSPFPTGDFGRRTSDNIIGMDVGAPAAGAAREVAGAAMQFSRQVGKMAEKAWTREGQADAAAAIRAEGLSGLEAGLRSGGGVDDESYNAIVREHRLTQRITAARDALDQAELANPENEGAFAEASGAALQAFRDKPTGDPLVDTMFDREMAVQRQASLRRVRQGQERARIETGRGAYIGAASAGETGLGQAIASAGFDDAGAQLVGQSLTEYAGRLARFGPREAFSVGGVEFAADPSRAGVVSAEELARQFDGAQARARMSWIVEAGQRSPDAAAYRAFVGQVQERWASGDPAFVGLDPAQMDQLSRRLEAGADRMEASEAAAVTAAGSQLRDLMTAAEYGADYDETLMRQLARASGDPGLEAQVEFGLRHGFGVTPASTRSGMPADGGFGGWVEFLLDDLEGPGFVGNDNGAGRAQWGVTERSHKEAWRDGKVDRDEARAIYRKYWDDIGGDRLPPALASAAASAAVVAGPAAAQRWLASAGGDVERFHDLQMAHFERLAAEDPAKYGGSLRGWRRRDGLSRARSRAMTASERAAEGYASDPIGYARGNGRREAMIDLPEFDINRLFGDDPAGTGAFLQGRLAAGRALNARSGVPVAVFDRAELAAIKDRIETDPTAVVGLVSTAAQTPGVGSEGVRVLLGQLGMAGTASADLHLGWLASAPTTRNVAQKVVEGRTLRAGGAKDVAFEDESIPEVAQRLAPALAAQPDLFAVIQSTARDMALSDAARGQLGSAHAYVNSALGATRANGTTYGGVTEVNGAPTLAPPWLRADRLDEALEIAAANWRDEDRPVYSNGRPIPPRELSRYRLRAMPNGNYRLVNPMTRAAAVAPSGGAFEFNIDQPRFRDLLARRLPGSVLPSGGAR